METRANQLAHQFHHAGLREGDVVAVIMENNEHMHAVMWAARRSGLCSTVNTHLTAVEERPASSTIPEPRRFRLSCHEVDTELLPAHVTNELPTLRIIVEELPSSIHDGLLRSDLTDR